MTIPESLGSLHCTEDDTASATDKSELLRKLSPLVRILIYLAYGATGIHRRAWLECFAATGLFHEEHLQDA